MHAFQFVRPLQVALATNSTSNAWATKAPQTAKPAGPSVIDIKGEGGTLVPSFIKLLTIGTGVAATTFSTRLYGWHRLPTQSGTPPPIDIWIPALITELLWTVGTQGGAANGVVPTATLLSSNVAVTTEGVVNFNASTLGFVKYTSPGSGLIAWALVPVDGWELLDFDFKQGTTAGAMNALYAMM